MRQKLLFTVIALFCFSIFSYGQNDAQNKLDNLKYYASVIREYSQTMRYYADSARILHLLDQMDEITISLEDEINKIVIPDEPEVTDNPEEKAKDQNTETNIPENTDSNLDQMPKYEDYEKESSGSTLSKMLPFKNKFNTSIKFQFGINSLIKSKEPSGTILSPDIQPGGSWYWDIALVRKARLGGSDSKVALNYGIGYLRNRFKIENDLRLVSNTQNKPEFVALADVKDHPRIGIGFINIPLSFTYAISKKVKLEAGGYLGYRVSTTQNISLKNNKEIIEEHRRASYNLNNWVYGTQFGLDVSGFDLIFRYNMSKLFKDSSVHDLNTWMVGTSFSLF